MRNAVRLAFEMGSRVNDVHLLCHRRTTAKMVNQSVGSHTVPSDDVPLFMGIIFLESQRSRNFLCLTHIWPAGNEFVQNVVVSWYIIYTLNRPRVYSNNFHNDIGVHYERNMCRAVERRQWGRSFADQIAHTATFRRMHGSEWSQSTDTEAGANIEKVNDNERKWRA